MGVVLCQVCRNYYDAGGEHACPGLSPSDWVRFLDALREWMKSDPHARFELYYARRGRPASGR